LEAVGKINSYEEEFQLYKNPVFGLNSEQAMEEMRIKYNSDFGIGGFTISSSEENNYILEKRYLKKSFVVFGNEKLKFSVKRAFG